MMPVVFTGFPYILALVAVWVLGPWAVRVCTRKGLVVDITDRHSHQSPTPHGGGFILPLVATPIGLWCVFAFHMPYPDFLSVLLLAGVAVAAVGWRDDCGHLDPRLRLAVHMPAVAVALVFLPQMFDFLPLWLDRLILLLAWGWFVNLYNFMDGADGLATSESIALGLGMALLVPAFAPLGLVLAAAGAGFLRVNASPAKVFMGDVSSTWLGYMFGGLLLVACADDTWRMVWPLATLTLVFCADATSTLIRRVVQGFHPWEAHKTFWFHRLLGLGLSHGQLVGLVAGVNMVLYGIAVFSLHLGQPEVGFAGSLLALAGGMWYIRHTENARKARGGEHTCNTKLPKRSSRRQA